MPRIRTLIISNDCDGATLGTMAQAQELFAGYRIPFSESCWWFAESVSLFEIEGEEVRTRSPDWTFLTRMIDEGKIDTLHTYGDFPNGGFSRDLLLKALKLIRQPVRFSAWTAHGGKNDLQNLRPLGLGDVKDSKYYHMDITASLGIRCFCTNLDVVVGAPPRSVFREDTYNHLLRYRGFKKEQVRSVNFTHLSAQIKLAENLLPFWARNTTLVMYTHLYARTDASAPYGWLPVDEVKVTPEVDECLNDLAERRDSGEIRILTLRELLDVKMEHKPHE